MSVAVAKRSMDVAVSLVCIGLLWPVCLLLAILIKLETPGPVFFVQKRMGKDERPFAMYKFRSMVVNTIHPLHLGEVKHNHQLVTRVGYVMRRTKLDEVPQFLNVLRGEMSLVGPRPCLIEQVGEITPVERRRFKFHPGMTSWADVNGNVEITRGERWILDVWYIDHYSLQLDIRILAKTLGVVISGSKRNERAIRAAYRHIAAITSISEKETKAQPVSPRH